MKRAAKKTFDFFYDILTSKPFIGAFTFIMFGLVMVVATGVVIQNGSLSVPGVVKFLQGTEIKELQQGRLQINNPNGEARLSFGNGVTSAAGLSFKGGQSDHFSAIPGANYDYYFFEDSGVGENKEVRIYGYPSQAEKNNYAKLQIIGLDNDLLISSERQRSAIVLRPKGKVIVEGDLSVDGDIYVTGCIYYFRNGNYVPDSDCA